MESNDMEEKIPESIVKYRKETTDGSPVRTEFDTFLAELGDRHLQKRAKLMYTFEDDKLKLTDYGTRVYTKLNVFCSQISWKKDQLYMVRGVDRVQLEEFICWYVSCVYRCKKKAYAADYKKRGIEITPQVEIKICEKSVRPMPRIVPIDIAVHDIKNHEDDYGNDNKLLVLYISAIENLGNTDNYYAKTIETYLTNKAWAEERCFIYSERDIPWLAHIPTLDLLTGKMRQTQQRVTTAPTPGEVPVVYNTQRNVEPGIQEISKNGNIKRNEDGDLV